MKQKLTLFVLMLASTISFSQLNDSTFFYLNGQPEYYCQQPDVCSFRLSDLSEYSGTLDPNVVIDVDYMGAGDGIHYIHFSPTATTFQKLQVANQIESDPNFEKFFMVATKSDKLGEPCESRFWRGTDHQICITFNDPEFKLADVQAFAASYEMDVWFAPDPSISGGVWVLEVNKGHKLHPIDSPTLVFDIAREMWENDQAIINKVVPSFRMFFPDDPNDPLYNQMWWAEDDVMTPTCYGSNGFISTEIGLDCAWNYQDEFGTGESYTGDGVVVAVLDFDGFQYTHPDVNSNAVSPGYHTPTFSSSAVLPFNGDFYLPYYWDFAAHCQAVTGIIGAQIGNNEGAAGVAPGCTIIPCIFQGTEAQFDALLMTLLALTGPDEVDVINLSGEIGNNLTVPEAMGYPFWDAVTLCHTQGRPGISGQPKGICMIASSGNDNALHAQVPAAHPLVFSVGATNPIDEKKTDGDGFDPQTGILAQWGSNYYEFLDVAAPGTCIITTDFQDSTFGVYGSSGYDTGNYTLFNGTSASTPIVSGIAALVLEKDPNLTNDQVYDAIRFSCEKVGGYNYSNLGADGRCLELGFGRVNACNALQVVDQLSIEEEQEFAVTYNNPVSDNLNLTFPESGDYDVKIYSFSGQLIYNENLNNSSFLQIDFSSFSSGMYNLVVGNSGSSYIFTTKIVKH